VCIDFEMPKLKYLSFFPARSVFRHAGMDVNKAEKAWDLDDKGIG